MQLRGRRLKFTAVAALMVLSLTGFSTGRGHGSSGGSGDSGGGGGCSSSSQDHDSSSSSGGTSGSGTYRDFDDDDDYTDDTYDDSGSSDTTTPLQDATVKLIDCATPTRAYATVEVTNPNAEDAYFTVTVDFLDAASDRVESASTDALVTGNETMKVQVDLSSPGVAAKVDHCVVDRDATAREY